MDHFNRLLAKFQAKQAVVAVIGLGYVGLPLAIGFARRGFKVIGVDDDLRKIEQLAMGVDYINGQNDLVKELMGQNLSVAREIEAVHRADVVIICVPTPLTRHREPDISYVESVSLRIGQHLEPGSLVVLESTTFPGTTEEVVKPNIEKANRVSRVGRDYFLAFSPERVDPGNPDYNTYNTTKVVGGVTPQCSELTKVLYESILEGSGTVKLASSSQAAEMEKLFENIFRSVNIALVNELAVLCKAMNLHVWEVLDLADTKPFGFMRFDPGPGIGGHCIPLDPFYLTWKAREFDLPTRFIELAGEINSRMPYHVVELVAEALAEKGLCGSRLFVLGVAYKRDVADARESPALKIIELLQKRGAQVDFHDPLVDSIRLDSGTLKVQPLSAAKDYDCVILVTDHSAYDNPAVLQGVKVFVDTRGQTWKRPHPSIERLIRLGSPNQTTVPARPEEALRGTL